MLLRTSQEKVCVATVIAEDRKQDSDLEQRRQSPGETDAPPWFPRGRDDSGCPR